MQSDVPPLGAAGLLKEKIAEIGMTQKEVAAAADVHASTLNLILTGKRPVTRAVLERCAKVTGLDPVKLRKADAELEKWLRSPSGKRAMARQRLDNAEEFAVHPFVGAAHIQAYIDAGELEITPIDRLSYGKARVRLSRGDCIHIKRRLRVSGDEVVEDFSESTVTEDVLVLAPGERAIIRSLETVRLPDYLACRVVGLGLHREDGYVTAAAEDFEPPFHDTLTLFLENRGSETLTLERGEQCMAASFYAFSDLLPNS